MRRLLLLSLGLVWGASGCWAEVKVTNPGFAERESFQYNEIVGGVSKPFSGSLALVGTGAAARYEFRTAGDGTEALFRLDTVTLLSLSSETVTKSADATVRRSADYRDLRVKAGPDDLPVTEIGSLPVVLRGFPWDTKKAAKLMVVGSPQGSSFSFELAVVGKETITAAGRNWECWHVTTGLGGALSMLVPKTDWWFAVEGSHPLVKTTGPSGGPGSPTRTLLLQTYQTGK